MNKLSIVIFSKNRALQLHSLLRSLFALSDAKPDQVTIVYTTDPALPYDRVRALHPACHWVEQGSFYEDVHTLASSGAAYITFLVDDLIFRQPVRYAEITSFLDANPDVSGFSLRLGTHIEGPLPEFEVRGNALVWQMAAHLGRHWNYFWEISSTVYRAEIAREYLKYCQAQRIRFPNPLEEEYYNVMPGMRGRTPIKFARFAWARYRKDGVLAGTPWNLWHRFRDGRAGRLACYETSTCLTQGINLVAARGIAYDDAYSAADLQRRLEKGERIAFEHLRDLRNTSPNAGREQVRFVRDD